MDLSTATEILSLDAEGRDIHRRIVRVATWVRVADDEDGSPLYASKPGQPGLPLSVAVALIVTAARVESRAAGAASRGAKHDQQVAGEGGEVSEPSGVHASTVAPSTTPGQVA